MPDSLFEDFEIKVENHLASPYTGTLGFGACLPPGQLQYGACLRLEDRGGIMHPLEWRTTIQTQAEHWAYFTFPASLQAREFKHFKVKPGARPVSNRLEHELRGEQVWVRNGDEELLFCPTAPLGLLSLARGGVSLLCAEGSGAEMEFESGVYRIQEPFVLSLGQSNAFEIVVQAEGSVTHDGGDSIYLRLRYKVSHGRPGLDINALFSNRRADDEEIHLRRFALTFGLAAPVASCVVRQNATGNMCLPRDVEISGGVKIEQGSAVDALEVELPERAQLWPFLKHFDRVKFFSGVSPFCGVKMAAGGALFAWQRATRLGTGSFAVAGRTATLELVSPGEARRPVPQGFSRSFDFSIAPLTTTGDDEAAYRQACRLEYTPLVSVAPRWFIRNGVKEMDRILPYRPDLHPRLEKQLWREFALPYCSGFYDAGDVPTGRGLAAGTPVTPPYTWNNNEEDHLKGIAWMWMRTGDPGYLEDLRTAGRHLMEVDRIAHSSHELQSGILIAHAKGHFYGAGYPSHCWAEGLLLYFKLTGEAEARAAFFQLCDCLLLWADGPDAMRFTDAREMGVPLTNFAHAYVLSGDEKYLRAAWIYIREFQNQMNSEGGLLYDKGGQLTPYAEYVAVEGLWDFYELVGGDEVRELLLRIIQWIWQTQIDDCGVYDARSTGESFLHIFYIAYKLTDDETWLERGRRGLDAALSQAAMHPLLKLNNNGAYYHEAMKRGWLRDELAPLDPCRSTRAVHRQYSEPVFGWEKPGRIFSRKTMAGYLDVDLNSRPLRLQLLCYRDGEWAPLRLVERGPDNTTDSTRWAALGIEAHLWLFADESDEWAFELHFHSSFATAVRIRLSVEAEDCFHLIPGNIHGDNNASRIQTGEFPLLAARTRDDDVFRSPLWAFCADRAPVPVSLLCLKGAAVGLSIAPYVLTGDGVTVQNGLFAELPNACGVSLGHCNEPVTFVNKGQWEEPVLHGARELRARGRIFAVAGEGRLAAHGVVRRVYEELREQPQYERTHREAAAALLDSFLRFNWSEEFGHYTNLRCALPGSPVLKPWRPLIEIGWSGGAALAYPFFLAQHALGLPQNYFEGRKSPVQICDEIVDGFNERSGLFYDLAAEWPAGSGSRLNGWWAGYAVSDCHCAYTNGNACFNLLKSMEFLEKTGQAYPERWLVQVLRVLDTVVSLQRPDGAFGVTFSAAARGVLDWNGFAGCWFAAALPLAYRVSGEERYLRSAMRALDFYGADVRDLVCSGTPMDTRHSVDQEGNLAFVRASRLMHEITGEARFLEYLEAGAHYEYLWRYGFRAQPHAPPLDRIGWNSCGASITSVSNPHAHPMGVTITGDLNYLAEQTGDSYHRRRAEDGLAWAMHTLELYPGRIGYGRYGVLSERFCPSDGLLVEKYDDGTPSSTWFSYNGWAAANVLEAVAEAMLAKS